LEHAVDGIEKYQLPLSSTTDTAPLPLAQVFILQKATQSATGENIRLLQGLEAINALMANTYRRAFLAPMRKAEEHFKQCTNLVRKKVVYSVRRHWGFEHFPDEGRKLHEHIQKVLDKGLTH